MESPEASGEAEVEQQESREQPNTDGDDSPVEHEGGSVFDEDSAKIPEERLLRNDQGDRGQHES